MAHTISGPWIHRCIVIFQMKVMFTFTINHKFPLLKLENMSYQFYNLKRFKEKKSLNMNYSMQLTVNFWLFHVFKGIYLILIFLYSEQSEVKKKPSWSTIAHSIIVRANWALTVLNNNLHLLDSRLLGYGQSPIWLSFQLISIPLRCVFTIN